jgi:hypothetical protein
MAKLAHEKLNRKLNSDKLGRHIHETDTFVDEVFRCWNCERYSHNYHFCTNCNSTI